jgi:hypothetical protein
MQAALAERELREFRIGGIIFQHQNADFLFHKTNLIYYNSGKWMFKIGER